MSTVPSFLRKAMPPAPAPKGPVSCGSFGLTLQGASWRYELLHDRPQNFLLWMTRGQGVATVNGVRHGISMHTALYLPAGTLFSLDLPNTAQSLYLESPPELGPTLPQAPLLLRVRDSLSQAELTGHIDAMQRELTQRRPFVDEAIEAHVALVGVWLNRQVSAGLADATRENAARRLTKRFAQMVTRDFRSARLMADYAEALDVTPTHLTRVCRQCCGKTAADILTERKLHAAREALEKPRPAVQQIAKDLGFTSPAYFTRFVQNHTGLAPTALRKQSKARRVPA